MRLLSRALVYGSVIVTGMSISDTVLADDHDHWHGDMRHFHEHDYSHWREGHWYHGDHDGHFGWWWLAAGMWYFYPAPVYPYPDPYSPPPVVVEQPPAPQTTSVPPPAQYWYYCNSARTYYPYVASCAEGWKKVPAQPSSEPAQ